MSAPVPATPEEFVDQLDFITRLMTLQVGDTEIAERLRAYTEVVAQINEVAWFGLLPLCLTLLFLHEHATAATSGRAFRLQYVAVRILIVVGLLLKYDLIIGLITSFAGGGDSYADFDKFFAWADQVPRLLEWSADRAGFMGGAAMAPVIFLWLLLLLFLSVCSLFAWLAMSLLAYSQSVLFLVLYAVGPTCIIASLVPGVGMAKSWAKMLAMVAAWSTIASILVGNFSFEGKQVFKHLVELSFVEVLKDCGKFLVAGIITVATPWVTAALFNGVASMAPGLGGPLSTAFRGGRMLLGKANPSNLGRAGGGRDRGGRDPSGKGEQASGHESARAGRVERQGAPAPAGDKAQQMGPQNGRLGRDTAQRLMTSRAAAQADSSLKGSGASSSAPVSIPSGAPGKERYSSHPQITERQRAQHLGNLARDRDDAPGPPDASPELSARVAQERGTLQDAYPGHQWDPDQLSPSERSIVAELDDSSSRFGGWEAGSQGYGDFEYAARMAEQRLRSSQPPGQYAAPSEGALATASADSDSSSVTSVHGPSNARARDDVPSNADSPQPGAGTSVPQSGQRVAAAATQAAGNAGRPAASAGARSSQGTRANVSGPQEQRQQAGPASAQRARADHQAAISRAPQQQPAPLGGASAPPASAQWAQAHPRTIARQPKSIPASEKPSASAHPAIAPTPPRRK